MLDDAFFNVEDWINSELALEFAEQEEIAFTSATAAKKPKGFLAYESPMKMTRPVRLANFSTLLPVRLPA